MSLDGEISIVPNVSMTDEVSIIKVFGVGGGGSNAVNYMYRKGIKGVEFIVCNTDIQDLRKSVVKNRIQIGRSLTSGLGAGCHPEIGKSALNESEYMIRSILESNTEMVFITAGMGGGTGTGAAPEIARIAKELGILTIGVVSVPFSFEGEPKIEQALAGIDELEKHLDAISIVVNDRILDEPKPLSEAFKMADEVLTVAVKSIAEIIMLPGYINVDLRDVYSVMRNSGITLIGSGEADGENRAEEALQRALVSPLLKYKDIRGAANVLVHVQYGDKEMLISERDFIMNEIQSRVGQNVDLIWGAGHNTDLGDKLRVAVIATGFNGTGQRMESTNEGNIYNSIKKTNTSGSTERNYNQAESSLNDINGNKNVDEKKSGYNEVPEITLEIVGHVKPDFRVDEKVEDLEMKPVSLEDLGIKSTKVGKTVNSNKNISGTANEGSEEHRSSGRNRQGIVKDKHVHEDYEEEKKELSDIRSNKAKINSKVNSWLSGKLFNDEDADM